MDKTKYQKRVEEVSPKTNSFINCVKAFFIGGTICTIGQVILEIYLLVGIEKSEAAILTSITMIFLGAFLTGIDVYDEIAKYAGAGTVVPITGFANSIVSPAIEYKREGYIFGVGTKMFSIAGPVIVYGIITSVAVGVVYYIISLF